MWSEKGKGGKNGLVEMMERRERINKTAGIRGRNKRRDY